MRKALLALTCVIAASAIAAPGASAHPLGNFSINHLATVRISHDRADVHYVLDQAEIPTVAERGVPRARLVERKRREVTQRLALVVDGRRVPLRPEGRSRLSFPRGQGGLATTRLELDLSAHLREPRRVVLRDGTFPDRVGWKAIVSAPGERTAVRSDAPSGDPTGGLRRYPQDVVNSPADRREATFSVRPGDGTLSAPRADGEKVSTTRAGGDGLAGLFEDAASGRGVLLLLLAAAFGWGALHAASPGHGKAMVAAYLVGTRGTARHAAALGATVTITHTSGVFALGVVTLALSQYVLPEDLYPWLTLASGLLVLLVGVGVLRSRLRPILRRRRSQAHDHSHHGHDPEDHQHRAHHHEVPKEITWRGLIGMGTAAGLIPCPSALVVLLAAVSQHQVALGLVLIVAFSLGLAGTLTGLGLAVLHARRLLSRVRVGGPTLAALPAISALLIVVIGCVLTVRAVPGVV